MAIVRAANFAADTVVADLREGEEFQQVYAYTNRMSPLEILCLEGDSLL